MTIITPGTLAWADLNPVVGKEQAGRRPIIVIASQSYLDLITDLVIMMPITSHDRNWPNHIRVEPADLLARPSWIMTEQIRTIARQRIHATIGQVDSTCLNECRSWLSLFTDITDH